MAAYYNENDPKKAAVLRELIKWGLIAPGEVDERSIEDVRPNELAGFTQCHFFAGAGIWSYALRLAGWPDSRPCWTGSCPCPSFSAAGKGEGFEDARHLWPAWYRLISECGPATVFGEQVEAAIGYGWIDLVQTDLEAQAYAFGKIVLGACSVGAPHIRLRVYFVADSAGSRHDWWRSGETGNGEASTKRGCVKLKSERYGNAIGGSESVYPERRALNEHGKNGCNGHDGRRTEAHSIAGTHGEVCERGDTQINGHQGQSLRTSGEQTERTAEASQPSDGSLSDCLESEREGLERHFGDVRDWRGPGWLDPITARSVAEAGATRGFWADCDWWYGRDGKYRPIGTGLFPLAHGAPARVVRLRCYGDGIVPQAAQAFIEAYMSTQQTVLSDNKL